MPQAAKTFKNVSNTDLNAADFADFADWIRLQSETLVESAVFVFGR